MNGAAHTRLPAKDRFAEGHVLRELGRALPHSEGSSFAFPDTGDFRFFARARGTSGEG